MSWDSATSFLLSNLGISFGDLLLFLCLMAGFIFYAKELRIGLIAHLTLFSLVFLGLSAIGLNEEATRALIIVFVVGVALTLSLLTKSGEPGAK
jgi:hypothetical protein